MHQLGDGLAHYLSVDRPVFRELPVGPFDSAQNRHESDRSFEDLEPAPTVRQLFERGNVPEGMAQLAEALWEQRTGAADGQWEDVCRSIDPTHPMGELLWQDPFTRHSYQKPRGYSGDAQLLDYIYGITPPPADTTELGASVFNYMMQQQGARSVRARRTLLAGLIDQTADERPSARILSIACGHLREALISQAVMEGRVGEFVAFDQDAESLAEVQRTFGDHVRTVSGSVKTILSEKTKFRDFDFVYAAGLYDYLNERVATRLTRLLFDMLAPGGRLLVANFAPTLPEVGYMETFMDWKLIYRTPDQVAAFSNDIAGDEWKSEKMFWDEHENVVFLELVRRSGPARVFFNRSETNFVVPGLKNVITAPETRRVRRQNKKATV